MKFTTLLLAFAATTTLAQTITNSNAPAETTVAAAFDQKVLDCLKTCREGDVACQARCLNNPNPSEEDANDTIECVRGCDQGTGTEESNLAFGKCVQKCIDTHFFTSLPAGTQPTKPADSSDSDDSSPTAGAGGSNGNGDEKDGDKDGEDNKDSAGASKAVGLSVIGAAALFAAAFVL